jgi:hypothetical protein
LSTREILPELSFEPVFECAGGQYRRVLIGAWGIA